MGADERAVGGDACAEHGGGFIGGDVVGDLEGEVLVGAYVARVASLSHGAVRVGGIVGIWSINVSSFQLVAAFNARTNLLRAVVFIVAFANLAIQACPDLGSNAYPVPNLHRRHIVTDFDSFADDFMAHAEREIGFAPATGYRMHITSTYSTSILIIVSSGGRLVEAVIHTILISMSRSPNGLGLNYIDR